MTHVWAERGSRPSAVRQTEYQWSYVLGAVIPLNGASSALIAPTVNAHLMSEHLKIIAAVAGDDVHVVLVCSTAPVGMWAATCGYRRR